jgi:hypothetical protein
MAGSIQAAGTDFWPLRVTCVECFSAYRSSPPWCAFLFVLFVLPVTRKRAKVHGSHLRRVVVMSLLPLLVFSVLFPIAIFFPSLSEGYALLNPVGPQAISPAGGTACSAAA